MNAGQNTSKIQKNLRDYLLVSREAVDGKNISRTMLMNHSELTRILGHCFKRNFSEALIYIILSVLCWFIVITSQFMKAPTFVKSPNYQQYNKHSAYYVYDQTKDFPKRIKASKAKPIYDETDRND